MVKCLSQHTKAVRENHFVVGTVGTVGTVGAIINVVIKNIDELIVNSYTLSYIFFEVLTKTKY